MRVLRPYPDDAAKDRVQRIPPSILLGDERAPLSVSCSPSASVLLARGSIEDAGADADGNIPLAQVHSATVSADVLGANKDARVHDKATGDRDMQVLSFAWCAVVDERGYLRPLTVLCIGLTVSKSQQKMEQRDELSRKLQQRLRLHAHTDS